MKTLKTIQTLSKIGKIFCKVIFILCLIGAIGCAAGIVSLALVPEGLEIGNLTIKGLIEKSSDISVGACYAAMAVGIVYCAGEAVLCKIAEKYFKNELEAGTPFTLDGAKELMRLGILTICIPLATVFVSGIVYGVMSVFFKVSEDVNLSNFTSVGLGVMFIVMSLICRYGAEITDEGKNPEEQ